MLKREEILKILKRAAEIDSHRELFASKEHQYILNPPIEASAIRIVEEKFGFTLPDDYFRFITEIGDGGAGPDYGIYPFADFMKTGRDDYAEKHLERYRRSVAKPFVIRQMTVDEINAYVGEIRHPGAGELDSYGGVIRHPRRQNWTLTYLAAA